MPSFIRQKGTATVYKVNDNGTLQGIQSPEDLVAQGGSFNNILETDALPTGVDYAAIDKQVGSTYDPQLATAEQNASEATQLENSNAERLRKTLAETIKRRNLSDPYANSGIVSGANNAYNTSKELEATTGIESDLSTKLSNIAKTLANTRTAVTEGKNSLRDTLVNQARQGVGSFLSDQAKARQAEQQAALDNYYKEQQLQIQRANAAKSSDGGFGAIVSALLGQNQQQQNNANGVSPVQYTPPAAVQTKSQLADELRQALVSGKAGNRQDIVNALAAEGNISPQEADQLYTDVSNQIANGGNSFADTTLLNQLKNDLSGINPLNAVNTIANPSTALVAALAKRFKNPFSKKK